MNAQEIASVAYSAGFRGGSLAVAVAVALAESGGDPSATHRNSNGSTDRGLWQINSVHSQYDAARLLSDPAYNARAAFEISGGGANFRPWAAYTNLSYRTHLSAAEAVAGTAGSTASTPVGLPAPGDIPNAIGGALGGALNATGAAGLLGAPFGIVNDWFAGAAGGVATALLRAGITTVFVLGALALIGMGLNRLTGHSPVEVFQKAQGAVGTAASVAAVV